MYYCNELLKDSRFFEPQIIKEPEFDGDGKLIEQFTKDEAADLLGEYKFERAREKCERN